MLAIFTLSLAVVFELGAAFIALRVIFYAKRKSIWIGSFVTLLLLALQSIASLIHILSLNSIDNAETLAAIIDLLVSICLVIVISYGVSAYSNSEQAEKTPLQNLSDSKIVEEVSHIGYWDWHILTNELYWSGEIYEIFGLSPKKFKDTFEIFMMCVHPDDRKKVQNAVDAALARKGPYNIEHRIINQKDEQVRRISEQGEVTFDSEGKPIRMFGIVRDITGQAKADIVDLNSEMNLSAIQNISLEAIIMFDESFKIIHFNQGAKIIFGYKREEVLEKAYSLLLPTYVFNFNKIHNIDLNNFTQSTDEHMQLVGARINIQGQRKDGSLFPAEASISKIAENGKVVFAIFLRDISEQQAAETKIQQQVQNLTALRDIDLAITGNTDIRIISDVILEKVLNQLDIDAAIIFKLNPDTGILEHIRDRGFRHIFGIEDIPFGESIAGRVAWQRETLRLENIDQADISPEFAKLLSSELFEDYYCTPLIAKGQVKGVLEIFNRTKINPSDDWLSFFEALGGQTAIALDNIELFKNWQKSHIDLVEAYDTTLEGWSRALDLRDEETEGHSRRVTEMTMRLAKSMGVSDAELIHIRRGALLHDIGKMGIPDSILLKPGPLNDLENEIMREHPQYAHDLLSNISYLKPALEIPYSHHEKWDGSGYPRGLKGEAIPLASRIFMIVDVWDALHSDRPYRKAWSNEAIIDYVKEQSGKHFDPSVVEVFLQMLSEDETSISGS